MSSLCLFFPFLSVYPWFLVGLNKRLSINFMKIIVMLNSYWLPYSRICLSIICALVEKEKRLQGMFYPKSFVHNSWCLWHTECSSKTKTRLFKCVSMVALILILFFFFLFFLLLITSFFFFKKASKYTGGIQRKKQPQHLKLHCSKTNLEQNNSRIIVML